MMEQILSLGGDLATDTVIRTLKSKLGGVVHVLLGAVAFDVLTGPSMMDESFSANFAEHPLIEGKPRLQWVGDNLNEVTWQLMFHAGFCTPTLELLKLRAAIAAHMPLPLVLMSGAHQGWFVPVSVDVTTRMTRHDGTVLWLEARLTMRECPPPKVLPDVTASQPAVAIEQIGANGAVTQPSQTVSVVPDARDPAASPIRSAA
jgi:phage protein U